MNALSVLLLCWQLFDVATPTQREVVVAAVENAAATLRRYTYGKHILARLSSKKSDRVLPAMPPLAPLPSPGAGMGGPLGGPRGDHPSGRHH